MTAAAPVAVAAGPGCRRPARGRRRGAGRVRRRPRRGRRQEDQGHQGGPDADEPGAQGGEGARRGRAQARPREGLQGGRREGQGAARRGRRQGRAQVGLEKSDIAYKTCTKVGRVVALRGQRFILPATWSRCWQPAWPWAMLGLAVSARSCLPNVYVVFDVWPNARGASRRRSACNRQQPGRYPA